MSRDARASSRPGRHVTQRVAVVAVALLLAAVAAGGSGTDTAPEQVVQARKNVDPTYTDITFVQANISKDMSIPAFDQDVATVFAQQPDIITFNEVYARDSAKLAPEGYTIWRTPGIRTGWAPVVWNSSKWTAIDQGTRQISKSVKKGTLIGVRYANWVTLQNPAGQVLSVISTHIAPNNKDTAHLLVPSLKVLNNLAKSLRERGPVLMGGDFNMGYHSSRYQPQYLSGAGLVSTFDLLGSSFPTHRKGGTIDYVFLSPRSHFFVTEQYPVPLKSDHTAIGLRMQLLSGPDGTPPPTFKGGTFTANPAGSTAERRKVRDLEVAAIDATPTGAAIHVASRKIRGNGLFRALRDAHHRGVHVTVVSGERGLTPPAKELRRLLRGNVLERSYLVRRPQAWTGADPMPATMLLISRTGGTSALSLTANTDMSVAPMKPKFRTVTKAKLTVGVRRYDGWYQQYLAAVGR